MDELKKLGRYEIADFLGKGSFGVVYRAKDPLLGRELAIKVMSASVAQDEGVRQRFYREAEAAANLNHVNIVSVFDMGGGDGAQPPYIVMEYVAGDDLASLMQRGHLPLRTTLDLLIQVCEGLEHAHGNNVVHRDIKPANIRITKDGTAKIVDFGVARVTSSVGITQSGLMVGTPSYASPEQYGSKGSIDGRSDVFSAGVIFYEMLTGRKPFPSKDMLALMREICVEPHPSPKTVFAACDEELVAILDRSLAKDRDQRYPSAREFGRAMTDFRSRLLGKCLELQTVIGELCQELEGLRSKFDSEVLEAALGDCSWMEELLSQRTDPDGTMAADIDYSALLRGHARFRKHLDEVITRSEDLEALSQEISQCKTLFESQDWDGCLEHLGPLLDRYPKSRVALELKEQCQERIESGEDLKRRSQEMEGQLEDAAAHLAQGRHQQAFKAAQTALELEPQHKKAQQIHQQAQRGIEMAEALEQARQAAQQAAQQGDYEACLEACAAGLQADPKASDLGDLQKQARAAIKRRDRINSISRSAQEALQEGRLDEALDLIDRVLVEFPDSPDKADHQNLREEITAGIEERERAQEAARQARLSRDLDHARKELREGRFQKAVQRLEAVLKRVPDEQEALSLKAQAEKAWADQNQVDELLGQAEQAFQLGDWKACLAAAEKGLGLSEGHAGLGEWAERARRELESQARLAQARQAAQKALAASDFAAARQAAREAIEIDGDDKAAQELLRKAEQGLEERVQAALLADEAEEFIKLGNWSEALAKIDQAAQITPQATRLTNLRSSAQQLQSLEERVASLLKKARAAGRQSLWEEAFASLDEVLKASPDHPQAKRMRAEFEKRCRVEEEKELAERQRRLAEQERKRSEQEKARQNEVAALLKRARSAARKSAWEDGFQALDRALALIPDHPPALRLKSEFEKDRTAEEKRLQEERLAAIIEKARQAAEEKRWEEASAAVQELLKEAPDDPRAIQLKGEFEGLQREEVEARKRQQVEKSLDKARAAAGKGRWDEAFKALEGALSTVPGSQPALQLKKELEEKRRAAQERRREERVEAFLKKARSAAEKSRWKEALQCLDQARSTAPGHQAVEKLRRKIEDQQRAEEKRLRFRDAFSKAKKAADKGRWDEAWEAGRRAAEIDPQNAELRTLNQDISRRREIIALEQRMSEASGRGRHRQALSHAQGLLNLKPDSKTARTQLKASQKALQERRESWLKRLKPLSAAAGLLLVLGLAYFFWPSASPVLPGEVAPLRIRQVLSQGDSQALLDRLASDWNVPEAELRRYNNVTGESLLMGRLVYSEAHAGAVTVRINVRPWGRIVSIRPTDQAARPIDLGKEGLIAPVTLRLAPGEYQVRISHPNLAGALERILQVSEEGGQWVEIPLPSLEMTVGEAQQLFLSETASK